VAVPQETLAKMKSPADTRPGAWRGGVIQVKVTTYCDLDCKNCSVAVGIARKLKRQWNMPVEAYREALKSLKGFPGVVGLFGGNPCLHPQFEDLCQILEDEFPDKDQRGLWSNRLYGHGTTCRRVFSPQHSNLNVHGVQKAYEEIRWDWPEANPVGLKEPSMHGPLFGALKDVGYTEAEMWAAVGNCPINQNWSACITYTPGSVRDKVRGYFCEIAATQAEISGEWYAGIPVYPGWWVGHMEKYKHQVDFHCRHCLVPMSPAKVDAAGQQPEAYTETWGALLTPLMVRGRAMRQVADRAELAGNGTPATAYLPKAR
jgi:hypothetical protein